VSLLADLMGGEGRKYKILLEIQDKEMSREDLAERFGITVQAAGKELKELRDMFLVEERVVSRRKYYRLTGLGSAVIKSLREAEEEISKRRDEAALIAERRLSGLNARIRLIEERIERMKRLGRSDSIRILERELRRVEEEREILLRRMRKLGLRT